MNILLTGATGFLGSRLALELATGRNQLTVLVREGSSLARLQPCLSRLTVVHIAGCNFEELIQQRKIDLITHCATNYGRLSISRPDIVDANLVLPLRILDGVVSSGRKVAFINTDTLLDKRISSYSLSKKQFREWLQCYADVVTCINVLLEHFYGPGDDPSKFVSAIVRSLICDEPRIALTLGEQERDFIYIDDVVSAICQIIDSGISAEVGFHEFEIGLGQSVTIRDFVELTKQLSGNNVTRLDFGALPYRANEAMKVMVDTRRIRSLGWQPRYSISDGLKRMIAEERA